MRNKYFHYKSTMDDSFNNPGSNKSLNSMQNQNVEGLNNIQQSPESFFRYNQSYKMNNYGSINSNEMDNTVTNSFNQPAQLSSTDWRQVKKKRAGGISSKMGMKGVFKNGMPSFNAAHPSTYSSYEYIKGVESHSQYSNSASKREEYPSFYHSNNNSIFRRDNLQPTQTFENPQENTNYSNRSILDGFGDLTNNFELLVVFCRFINIQEMIYFDLDRIKERAKLFNLNLYGNKSEILYQIRDVLIKVEKKILYLKGMDRNFTLNQRQQDERNEQSSFRQTNENRDKKVEEKDKSISDEDENLRLFQETFF